VKILDFGLARDTSVQSGLTGLESRPWLQHDAWYRPRHGRLRGAGAGYAVSPPIIGQTLSRCVLYEMLTGDRAYNGETAAETMAAILREDSPPIHPR